MIWKKYGKKSVQTFNCFCVLDSVCQFGACLAAWLRRKHQKKSQMCQLGLTSLEFQNRFFYWTMVWNHWFLWSLNFSPLIYGFLGQFLPWHRTLRRILTELGCHLGRSGSIPFSTSHKKWGEQINIPGHQSKSMETHKVYGGEKSTSTCWKTVALLFFCSFQRSWVLNMQTMIQLV